MDGMQGLPMFVGGVGLEHQQERNTQ